MQWVGGTTPTRLNNTDDGVVLARCRVSKHHQGSIPRCRAVIRNIRRVVSTAPKIRLVNGPTQFDRVRTTGRFVRVPLETSRP